MFERFQTILEKTVKDKSSIQMTLIYLFENYIKEHKETAPIMTGALEKLKPLFLNHNQDLTVLKKILKELGSQLKINDLKEFCQKTIDFLNHYQEPSLEEKFISPIPRYLDSKYGYEY